MNIIVIKGEKMAKAKVKAERVVSKTREVRLINPVKLPVLECLKPSCRHRWLPRVGSPQECPKCKGGKMRYVGYTTPTNLR